MKTMEELLMVAVDRDSDGERMPENCYYVGSGSIWTLATDTASLFARSPERLRR